MNPRSMNRDDSNPMESRQRRYVSPTATLMWILFGAFVFGIGWFVGIWRLWMDQGWTTAQKLIATLIVPGGLLPAVTLLGMPSGSSSCSTGLVGPSHQGPVVVHCITTGIVSPAIALFALALLILAPISVAIFMHRKYYQSVAVKL